MNDALLVLDQHRLNVRIIERIVNRQNMGTGHAKHMTYAQALHILDDQFTYGQLHSL